MKKFLLVLLFSSPSLCQGILLEKGITSLSGAYNYVGNDVLSTNGGAIVFSFRGIVDLGVGFSKTVTDDSRIELTSLTPSLSYTIRPTDRPGGFTLRAGYVSGKITSRRAVYYSKVPKSDDKVNISGPVLNAGAGIPFYSGETLAVLAIVGLSFSFLSTDDGYDDNSRALSLEIVIRPLSKKLGFFISPGVAVDLEDDSSWMYGATFGLLLNIADTR